MPTHSDERPLDAVRGAAMVGDGAVVVGELTARVGRIVPAVVPRLARPGAGIVRSATTLVTDRGVRTSTRRWPAGWPNRGKPRSPRLGWSAGAAA